MSIAPDDLRTAISGVGSLLLAASGFTTGYLRLRSERSKASRREEDCRRRVRQLQERLSAMETELVVLRKLLPGGEWYVRLGLDKEEVYTPNPLGTVLTRRSSDVSGHDKEFKKLGQPGEPGETDGGLPSRSDETEGP